MRLQYGLTSDGPLLVVSHEAAELMTRFRQLRPKDKEAGGQLFARFEGSDVIIVEATPPTLLDRRSRCAFRPNRMLQQRQITQRYGTGLHFVGDWHTHPQPRAASSSDDVSGMIECFQRSMHDLNAFVMIIVGTEAPPEGWYVALVTASGTQRLTCLRQEPIVV